MEADYARTHKDLAAKVHMVAGSYETYGPTPRHYDDSDLAGTMTRFAETLGGRGYRSLTVSSEVADGEDHFTVFHDVASRGLLRVLPGKGPYTSGLALEGTAVYSILSAHVHPAPNQGV